jgi:DNA-binding CsgD family transcriptional regulator
VWPWGVVVLVVAFFAFAGTAVAATATALAAISQEEPFSAVTMSSFLLVCGVAFLTGVLFAVAGKGASRLLLAGASFSLGFGAVYAWSPSVPLISVLAPAGLIGFFWLLASFPGVRPKPSWLTWVVAWLAVWSGVCFGVPTVREAIDTGTDPWISLVAPGFLAGLAAIVVGKALDFRRADTATRRWYLILGAVIVLSMIGAGISAALAATGHVVVGNGVDEASTLLGNLATASILATVGAAAIKEGYYGVAVTEEQRRAAWRTMFPDDPPPEAVPFDLQGLTYREKQLLPLLAAGTPTRVMAQRLGISEKTVRNYLSGLYAKLGANDRATGALAARDALDFD